MVMYAVHNTVRSRANRTLRASAPAHHRLKLHVGAEQARVVRGRPLLITEEKLLRDLEDLRSKNAEGRLEVRTMDGRIFDLASLTPAPMAPPAPMVNAIPGMPVAPMATGIPMSNIPAGKTIESLPEYSEEEDETGEVVAMKDAPSAEEVDLSQIPADMMPEPDKAEASKRGGKGRKS